MRLSVPLDSSKTSLGYKKIPLPAGGPRSDKIKKGGHFQLETAYT